eukprot:gene2359-2910_t
MNNNNKIFQFKLVLLGEAAVGKSSLVLRFVRGHFLEYQESTIGAGQERYHTLAPMYYRGAQAAIVVYDIRSEDSFERAIKWVKELQRQGNPNIVIALAGNKLDLAAKRRVETAEAQQYAEENGLLFMETSAKTSQNVNELFVEIAQKLPKTPTTRPGSGRLPIPPIDNTKPQKKSCCN